VSYASRKWAAGQAARDAAQAERYARQPSIPAIDYVALANTQSEAEAKAKADAEARLLWEQSPEGLAHFAALRAEVAEAKAKAEAVAADNAAAILALEKLLPLTVEQVESLPHHKQELTDCVCPKYGAVIKSHKAPSRYGHGNCTYSWVAVVSLDKITSAAVASLKPTA